MTLSRWLMCNVGRVRSSEGNYACCPLYSSAHYRRALKHPGVLCIRKKDVKFAFLSSFIRVTCDLYLIFCCNRVPNKKTLEHSQSIIIEAMLSSEHSGWALNQRMLFKWQQWKRFVKFCVTIDEFVWKNRDHYQHGKLWDITVKHCVKCFCTLLRLIFITALGIMWYYSYFT